MAAKMKDGINQSNEDEKKIIDVNQSIDRIATFITSSSSNIINNESSPKIFKLNVDCFEYVFEWLSLEELLKFRHTCKQLKQIVDNYIKFKYTGLTKIEYFHLAKKYWNSLFEAKIICFEWIKHLYFAATELTHTDVDSMKYVFNQLETLKMYNVKVDGDFYDVILQHCTRLKYLSVITSTFPKTIIGTGNEWLIREYPSFEQFELDVKTPIQYTNELLVFFKRNPNIKVFSTRTNFLMANAHLMLGIKFDRLDIFNIDLEELDSFCTLANGLHEQDFFKQLHIYCSEWRSSYMTTQLTILPSYLEKLHFYKVSEGLHVPVMENLKEFSTTYFNLDTNDIPKIMAINFINLRQIKIIHTYLYFIKPFICYAPKLEQIKVQYLFLFRSEKLQYNDFVAMNEERKKLAQACKVTIFIDEKNFLTLKWMATMNLSLIELKRSESSFYSNCAFLDKF